MFLIITSSVEELLTRTKMLWITRMQQDKLAFIILWIKFKLEKLRGHQAVPVMSY